MVPYQKFDPVPFPGIKAEPELLAETERLPRATRRFAGLLGEIIALTQHLELRYRGILPFHATPGRLRRIGMAVRLATDPVTSLWVHNDRLERRMLELRRRRRDALEYYFALNKRLRKEHHRLIPALVRNLSHPALLREASWSRARSRRRARPPRATRSSGA